MTNSVTNSTHDSADILSRADCEALFHRIAGYRTTPWDLTVTIRATWSRHFRWSRSRPRMVSTTTEQVVTIVRGSRPDDGSIHLTSFDDATLQATIQTLEQRFTESAPPPSSVGLLSRQQYAAPELWSETTAQTTLAMLSNTAQQSVAATHDTNPSATAAGPLLAAGATEVGAASWAIFNTNGLAAYAAVTGAKYSETVRAVDGTASGNAAKRTLTWKTLDTAALANKALTRCVASAHPVAIEPGRYTTIVSADVVGVMLSFVMTQLERIDAEAGRTIFSGTAPGTTKIGQPVFDARLTITSDPTDPECGYIPFDPEGNPYTTVNWIERGVLTALSYGREYASHHFGTAVALPNPTAFRASGGATATTSIEEMIATTERGIVLYNCGLMGVADERTLMLESITRDGVFLVERGKIVHPVKNMWFRESPVFIFNKVVQIGPAVVTHGFQSYNNDQSAQRDLPPRALCDGSVALVAPPMKVQDFNFVRLTDAV